MDAKEAAERILDADNHRLAQLVKEGRITIRQALDDLLVTYVTLYGTGQPSNINGTIKIMTGKRG